MFSHKFLIFFGLVLFVAVVSANVNVEKSDVPETRLPELSEIINIIKEAVKWAAKNCLREAALNCKQYWPDSKALLECAKEFLKENKGRCVVGG